MVAGLYPYDLKQSNSDGGFVNSKGNVFAGSESWVTLCKCRDEQSGEREVQGPDGVYYTYSAIVYAPKSCPDLKKGDRVQVISEGKVRIEETVKNFSRDFFHCRIWV